MEKRDAQAPAHITTPPEIELQSVALCAQSASAHTLPELQYQNAFEMCYQTDFKRVDFTYEYIKTIENNIPKL